jgi:predicted nucleotidyltransferase
MSLFEELIEDKAKDKKIVKSFTPKDSLSEQIFADDNTMREDIQSALLKIANEFIDFLGLEFFIHDVVLTGSLANYNWSNFSDVDLHIVVDFEESKHEYDLLKEFFDSKKNVWNEKHNIKIKGYDVELYVQDISEPHVSSGVYSILHNKWEVKPKKETPNIDDRKILAKGEYYAKKIDSLVNNANSKDVLSKIDTLRKKIKEFRQCGLESGGEYSYENLTFKLLRRNGYIEKLMTLKNYITDKKLSVAQ